jgi:hypothetical protein
MSIDQRLHHAGRDIREMSIEPPPFDSLGSGRSTGAGRSRTGRALGAVAVAVLLLGGAVLAGVAVIGDGAPQSDAASAPVGRASGPSLTLLPPGPLQPTAAEELQLIASLSDSRPRIQPVGIEVNAVSRPRQLTALEERRLIASAVAGIDRRGEVDHPVIPEVVV